MPRPASDRTKVSYYLPTKLIAALKRMAELKGTTYSDLIRQACTEFVVREAPKVMADRKAIDEMQTDSNGQPQP